MASFCPSARETGSEFPPMGSATAARLGVAFRLVKPRLSLPSLLSLALAAFAFVLSLAAPRTAFAAGSFKLKQGEATEVSGAWHIYVKIELPKAPPIAHQPLRFVFTKTMVYERSLVDGKSEPVVNRQALQNQNPQVESLDVDFADASVVTGQRNTSTVAPQALYFLNNPFPIEQAKASAARLLGEKLNADERITRAYRLCFGRDPTAGERSVTAKFVTDKTDAETWAAVFQALFASAEFRYVD